MKIFPLSYIYSKITSRFVEIYEEADVTATIIQFCNYPTDWRLNGLILELGQKYP
jgi:hypothetical protein